MREGSRLRVATILGLVVGLKIYVPGNAESDYSVMKKNFSFYEKKKSEKENKNGGTMSVAVSNPVCQTLWQWEWCVIDMAV